MNNINKNINQIVKDRFMNALESNPSFSVQLVYLSESGEIIVETVSTHDRLANAEIAAARLPKGKDKILQIVVDG